MFSAAAPQWCPVCGTAGDFQGLLTINDMSGTRTTTNIDVDGFDIYPVKPIYLENALANSFLSLVDHGLDEKLFLSNDGTEYSWTFPATMTRTFLMENS